MEIDGIVGVFDRQAVPFPRQAQVGGVFRFLRGRVAVEDQKDLLRVGGHVRQEGDLHRRGRLAVDVLPLVPAGGRVHLAADLLPRPGLRVDLHHADLRLRVPDAVLVQAQHDMYRFLHAGMAGGLFQHMTGVIVPVFVPIAVVRIGGKYAPQGGLSARSVLQVRFHLKGIPAGPVQTKIEFLAAGVGPKPGGHLFFPVANGGKVAVSGPVYTDLGHLQLFGGGVLQPEL